VRKTRNTVAIALIRTGAIEGEFTCGCYGEKVKGSCNLVIMTYIMACEQGTCSGKCELSAIIKGPKSQTVIY